MIKAAAHTLAHCMLASFDFAKMQDYKKRSVRRYRDEIQKLFDKNNITFIKGKATIRREKTIEVVGESGKEYLRAKNIIIATTSVRSPSCAPTWTIS